MPRIDVQPSVFNDLHHAIADHHTLTLDHTRPLSTLSDEAKVILFDKLFPPQLDQPISAHANSTLPDVESRWDCLAKWVAPAPAGSSSLSRGISTGPVSTCSTDLSKIFRPLFESIPQLSRGITVVHDDDATRLYLLDRLDQAIVQASPTDDVDRNTRQALCDWNTTVQESNCAWGSEELLYWAELDGALRVGLTRAVNRYISDPRNFNAGHAPSRPIGWSHPILDAGAGVTDRLLKSSEGTKGMQELKRLKVLLERGMEMTVEAAGQRTGPPSNGRPTKGFTIWIDNSAAGTRLRSTAGPEVPLEATFQIWAQTHANRCRWATLHNTSATLVFYLANATTLLVSNVIRGNAGSQVHSPGPPPPPSDTPPCPPRSQTFTLASAMVALALPDNGIPPEIPSFLSPWQGDYIDTKRQIAAYRKTLRDKRDSSKKKRKAEDEAERQRPSRRDDRRSPGADRQGGPSHGPSAGSSGKRRGGRDDAGAGRGSQFQGNRGAPSGGKQHPRRGSDAADASIYLGEVSDSYDEETRGPLPPLYDTPLQSAPDGEMPPGTATVDVKAGQDDDAVIFVPRSRQYIPMRGTSFLPHQALLGRPLQAFIQGKSVGAVPIDTPSVHIGRHVDRGHLWDVFEGLFYNPELSTPPRSQLSNSDHSPQSILSISSIPSLTRSTSTATSTPSPPLPSYGSRPIRVIVKIVQPSSLDWGDVFDAGLGANESIQALEHEANLYEECLSNMTSKAAPGYYGLWRSTNGVYMMILERLGNAVCDEWGHVPTILKPDIIRLYNSLHSAGVAHNDLQTRHIRYRLESSECNEGNEGNGDIDPACPKLALIDFDQASVVAPDGPDVRQERERLGGLMGVSPWCPLWNVRGPAW
ncbi:hypothetical protein, variant 1 [Cryptococcus amylolentus CBS 6039]|uniref:Protein kinase domain-containing protein n=2 Tax=Cryptococcus amylolentus CBS 6039 TaxID=1295533 RepID=A0A1E3HSK0_9TREE|nr:hypothetical protein L202_03349 [Cryptococcus amylolentus CBS 6039]XP_018994190.1 hypothetical protein, variant 1 [Cryptococcus amylolentus CBS 6039]ODN79342.1 hypothetical protein L202_03349 [Cryptococcus amylolentus CBS 6039]ODN79343.1 hypothetical protein, variant 1 [Cryptococcus amylolentus CBS 6039]